MLARRLSILVMLGLVFVCCGCDSQPKRYAVRGTVSYQGQPIKFGSISFRAEDGSTGAAQIQDGKYEVEAVGGLLPGSYRVAINYPNPKIPLPSGNEAPGEAVPIREMLPPKYNDQTELTLEVGEEDKNDANFVLK
jgi:hypothetical protein